MEGVALRRQLELEQTRAGGALGVVGGMRCPREDEEDEGGEMRRMRGGLGLGFILLALPISAEAEGMESAFSAIVRITGTRSEDSIPTGSGFVVAIEDGAAIIVTAAHVIQGAEVRVRFTAAAELFPVSKFRSESGGEDHGLAALWVPGIPAGVEALRLDVRTRLQGGEDLFLLGFPDRALEPRVKRGVFSGSNGKLLLVDRAAGEGASGGPVLFGDEVVGVITAGGTGESYGYAVNANVVESILRGWGVEQVSACQNGQKVEVNGIVFARVCAGGFLMGSAENDQEAAYDLEKPSHPMTLDEFWIGKYEITNAEYQRLHPDHLGEARLPATGLSWADARGFCDHFGFRLPTEAEWELAARADSQTAWAFGDDVRKLGLFAWSALNSGDQAQPVGTKEPNDWGVHDMHGNVWEWVGETCGLYSGRDSDLDRDLEVLHDPKRVLRGGAFNQNPRALRSASRYRIDPGYRFGPTGFRCALDSLPPVPQPPSVSGR